MGFSRIASIPMDHVSAEVAAFPLASEAALRLGGSCCVLDPCLGGTTRDLWRAAEKAVIRGFPSFSVDEALALRDKVWFPDGESAPVPLHKYLRRLALDALELRGTAAVPRLEEEARSPGSEALRIREPLARWRWRWMSLSLPPDLLLAARAPQPDHIPQIVETLSPTLVRSLMDQGFAETHMHLGAAFDFSLLWVAALNAIGDPQQVDRGAFASPGADLGEGVDLANWFVRAATARYLLAAYLFGSERSRGLDAFLLNEAERRWVDASSVGNAALLAVGLHDLLRGRLTHTDVASFVAWQSVYKRITGVLPTRFPENLEAALKADPIAPVLPAQSAPRPSNEMRFIAAALGYLEGEGREDRVFAELFWQVVRVGTIFYRHVTQRPLTPGLTWFVRFYERMRPARGPIGYGLRLNAAAEGCGRSLGLRSLEVRTAPDSTINSLISDLRAIEKAANEFRATEDGPAPRTYREAVRGGDLTHRAPSEAADGRGVWPPPLEVGVVYHFIKNRGGGADAGAPKARWKTSHADPEVHAADPTAGNPTGYRYARYFNAREREALTMIWTLRQYPLTLQLIRGLDVCTDELGVPAWVLAPLVRSVRKVSYETSQVLSSRFGMQVPPLRSTVHAGEDFVHLLTGLRLVDDAISYFGLTEGDRIGHAIALGVDAHEWSSRSGRIPMMRETRLFDLTWELSWYRRSRTAVPKRRRTLLESEIARLIEVIYQPLKGSHTDIVELIGNLHDGAALWSLGFPNGPVAGVSGCDPAGYSYRYLTDGGVFRRGREIEWIDPELEGEGEILAEIQRGIRAGLASREITVEVNPSSNLLIGDLGDLGQHPLWRMQPPCRDSSAPALPICIGSDDPMTFGTRLPQEYQLVHDALVLAGLSTDEARHWVDRVRLRGMETRFTLPVRAGKEFRAQWRPERTEPSLLLFAAAG